MPKHSAHQKKAEQPISREKYSHANDSNPVPFSKICHDGRLNATSAYTLKPSLDIVIEIDFSQDLSSTGLNFLSSAMKELNNKQNNQTPMDKELSDVFSFAVNYFEDKIVFSKIKQILALRDWYSQVDQLTKLSVKEKSNEKRCIVNEIQASLLTLIKIVKIKLTSAISKPAYKDVVASVVNTELFKAYTSHHEAKKAPRAKQKTENPHDHSPQSRGYDPKVLRSPKFDRSPMHLPRQPNLHNTGKSNPGKGRGRSGSGK